MLSNVRAIYRDSKKRRDNFWTEWVSRPPAAILVWALRHTRVTPNQVSFAAIAVAAAGCVTLVLWRTTAGALAGWGILQLAYVIDCADGQLARLTGQTSPVGALLDFMLDEVKAFLLIGAAAVREWLITAEDPRWLLIGLGGVIAAASGIALTTLMRRPEYFEATGQRPLPPSTDRSDLMPRSLNPLALIEAAGRLALHHPTWLVMPCALDRLDWFLYIYCGAHALHLMRASLIVVVRLGRPRARTRQP